MFKKILFIVLCSFFVLSPLSKGYAESEYTIKEMTPEIEEALENRRDRYEQLREYKTKGFIGENNQGYVDALSDLEEIILIIDDENKDRKIIYQTIAEQNNLKEALSTIESVFAQVQRDRAEPEDMIQLEDGTWAAKIHE